MLWLIAVFCTISLAFSGSPEENSGDPSLFEGDLKLLPDQQFAIELGTFGASKKRRWTNGVVPYILASSLSGSSSARRVIDSAMEEWSTKTCIRFASRTNQAAYIEFFKGSGCWSYVGMTGRKQQISLAGGCWHHGIVVHEIGHALGFWHEQSRPDRDEYITVVWDNINEGNKHNFNKHSSIDSLNSAYDYGSIMHYGRRAFSKNGRDTIVPKKSGAVIGQRRGLSASDAQQANVMYKCQQGTSKPPTPPQPSTPPRPTPPRTTPPRPTPPRTTPPRTTPPRPTRPGPSNKISIEIRSEGCDDPQLVSAHCGRAYIKVNSREYSRKQRGHNIVLVDYRTGRVEQSLSFDTHGSSSQASRMANILTYWAKSLQGKVVLIAVQDEGSRQLRSSLQNALVAVGATKPFTHGYRGSYALVGYTGPGRPSWIRQVQKVRRRGPSIIKMDLELQRPAGINVDLRSEGCDDPKLVNIQCGRAYIKVNGVDYALKRRGFNIVLVDHKTRRVEGRYAYDTHGSSTQVTQMTKQLNSWADAKQQKIVLAAIQDEGAARLYSSAQRALARLGAKYPVSPGYRGSYVLIGYTGPERPSWIAEVKNSRGKGPSLLKKTIPSSTGPLPTPPPTPPPTRPPPPGTTSGTRPPVGSCGKSRAMTRVIGGTDAAPGAWPWQIALLRSGRFSCGGSLIYADWIVTAAHCISSRDGPAYTILLGAHNRNNPQSHEQKIKGKRVIVHPQYGRPPLNNDIALIQLERPAKLSNRVSTVCLPSHNYALPLSSTCYITGWGKIKHPGSSHHTLQQAKLPPVDQQECKRKLAESPGGTRLSITDQMLCAGVKDTRLSGCHGDSGGPYVCRDTSNRFVLHGVVSWGSPRCAASERYTVFARVARFRNWIDQEIRKAVG